MSTRSSRRSGSTSRPATMRRARSRSSSASLTRLIQATDRPAHYVKAGVELTDVIEAYGLGWHAGNVVKYMLRYQHKGDALRDLLKAWWYLKRLIVNVERGR